MTNWANIQAAVETVQMNGAKRVDGDNFKVYKVSDGTVRIDIPPIKETK